MKTMNFKKTLIAALSAFSLSFVNAAEEPLKIGFVYVGPVGDFGWSYQHDQGRQAIEKQFGDKVVTTYVESVKEGADTERVINQLANDGNQLIFTTSFGFMNPTIKSAKRFPKVKFEHATGYKRAANVATYSSRFYEGRYIAGVLGGAMTKSNTIGYVASYPIPEVVRGINATLLGAKSVNPQVKIKVVWVNSWYDPAKETEAAKSLISAGADVIMQHTDSPAVPQIGEENDVWVVGSATDMSSFAPTKQLTAVIDDWSHYYIDRVGKVLDNSRKGDDTDKQTVDLDAFNEQVSAEIRTKAEQLRKDITAVIDDWSRGVGKLDNSRKGDDADKQMVELAASNEQARAEIRAKAEQLRKDITAVIDDWSRDSVGKLDNSWKSDDTWGGFDKQMVELAAFNEQIPAEIRAKAEQLRKDITAGTFHPFTGPIVDRDGKEVAKAGEVISDEQLLKMNYFVEGVEGDLPK